MLMSLSSQALWPTENHDVAHCWVMANRLKTSGLARAHFFVHRCFFDSIIIWRSGALTFDWQHGQRRTNRMAEWIERVLLSLKEWIDQTWANYGPRAESGPPVLLFWPAGTYANLNSHCEFSGRPFFSFGDHGWQWFSENKPQRCKTGIKNEVKTFYFGDHIRTWNVISKIKKWSPK